MNRREYERLQEALSALLDVGKIRIKGLSGKRKDGYELGVLAAKSALKACFYKQEDQGLTEVQNV